MLSIHVGGKFTK